MLRFSYDRQIGSDRNSSILLSHGSYANSEGQVERMAKIGSNIPDRFKPFDKVELEAMLLDALMSPANEISDADWDEMDREFEQRHASALRYSGVRKKV